MNEPSSPPPETVAEQVERCIDTYVAAWNEPDPDKRTQLLAKVMAGSGGYSDPARRVDGTVGLVEYIGDVLSTYPGAQIIRTSEVDVHHLFGRFTWRLVRSDGMRLQDSVDFVEFTRDGRIHRVTGFFGLQEPNDAP
jgi:hypothetical protein